ncbi:MAG: type III pantothenate kinase [Dehalococcoidia bacterium]
MLLAIDIGNTKIALGVFQGEELRATWSIASGLHRLTDEYAAILLNLLPRQGIDISQIHHAVLCSVVPPLISTFEELCQRYLEISPLAVEAGVKTGVRVSTDNPREVGADRVVNSAAAYKLYGGPVIIIDLGTAMTFDVVSREGEYLGGAIAPGMEIASEALFMRTAKLPRVELERPKHAIGRNTVAAMQSGIIFGYIGLIENIVARLRQELGGKATTVATGGQADIFIRETKAIDIVNPHLTLIGLKLIYELNSPGE